MTTHVEPSQPGILLKYFGWLDSDYFPQGAAAVQALPQTLDWGRVWPFAFLHLGCLGVLWVGWSPVAVGLAVALYFVRMFAITGFYHRYFSHRSFKTSRLLQGIFALWGLTAVQRGPLWWASHHRHHHRASDRPTDTHSPAQRGFWWAHIGWITCPANMPTDYRRIPDLAKYPELVFLNRFDWLMPLVLAAGLYALGETLGASWGTSGLQLLVWGFFISTVVLFHGTSTINSLAHQFGSQRFQTGDTSRNNFWLALLTLGEGWHNNHHYYQGATRQGFFWWEIDITYYILKGMAGLGLVWDLHPVPRRIYQASATSLPPTRLVEQAS